MFVHRGLPRSLKRGRGRSLAVGLVCLEWLPTIAPTMAEVSSAVRGRGESSLAALVGAGLLFPDATVVAAPVVVEALGVPPEFCGFVLAERDFSTVITMLGMSAVVTVLEVLCSSDVRGCFSVP